MSRFRDACLGLALLGSCPRLLAIEGAAYLKPVEGVRSVGLGGAVTALPGSPETLWYNPGALASLQGVEASFTRNSWPGGVDSDHVLLAGTLNWRHQLGLLYHRNAVQDVYRDALGKETGGFEVSSSVLGGVYAYSAEYFTIGVGIKQLSEVIERASGSSLVYDAGLLSSFASDEILLGLAVQNIGAAPQIAGPGAGAGVSVEAPLTLRGGAGLRFSGDFNALMLLVDYEYLMVSQRSDFALGVEYSERFEGARLGLRGGWDLSRAQLGGLAGLGLGAGVGYGPATVDYAFAPQEALGSSHRLSLSLLWDLKAKGREQELSSLYGSAPVAPAKAKPDPTPRPTPRSGFRVKAEAEGVGAALDALLAATPTAMPSPTPVVEVKKEKARGILGGIFNIFSFGSKKGGEEVEGEATEKPSVLKSVFRFLGLGSSSPNAVEDIEKEKEDAVVGTPQSTPEPGPTPVPTPTQEVARRLKGDGAVVPTPRPTAVLDKVKDLFKLGEEN